MAAAEGGCQRGLILCVQGGARELVAAAEGLCQRAGFLRPGGSRGRMAAAGGGCQLGRVSASKDILRRVGARAAEGILQRCLPNEWAVGKKVDLATQKNVDCFFSKESVCPCLHPENPDVAPGMGHRRE